MSQTVVVELANNALWLALLLSGPLLGAALGVGLVVSIIQAVTSIQEQTLSFVPKLFAVGALFLFLFSWMLEQAVRYASDLFRSLPGMVG
ncbi:MAG: flagellar biosynthesis protein FliQ [Gemmatimonadetes bacterium]|nr:flagellar biosynthesis protein FliQ [Gemmatimonadota bacterium]